MIARLRLLLAILVLALAPALAPAVESAAIAPAVTAAGEHDCGHACAGMEQADHGQTACPCAAHLSLAPLVAGAALMPVSFLLTVAVPAENSLTSARWPPPLRPPRV